MIERISFALIDESGNVVPIEPLKTVNVGVKIEMAIADCFAEIRSEINELRDDEIKIAEKFNFALNLQRFLKEMKETYAD